MNRLNSGTLELLNFERIRLLYRNGLYGLIGVLVNSLLSLLFFWDKVSPNSLLLLWIALISTIGIARWLLVILFNIKLKNQQIDPSNVQVWEWFFYAGYSLSGVIWAASILFPFESDLLNGLIFITLVHVGMISAANTIYTTSLLSIRTYLTITMVPLTIKLFSLNEESFMIIGLMCSAYYIFMIRLTKVLNETIINNIKLKIENEKLSLKDSLTGLWNRRRLYLFMEKLLPQLERNNALLSIILFDVDFFKKYNDTNGHNAGDQLLSYISKIIQSVIREGDLAVRYGGEEFLIVLPSTDLGYAKKIAERVRKSVKENTPVTISGGLALYSTGMSFEEIILEADKLLYKAKEGGRDRIFEHKEVTNTYS